MSDSTKIIETISRLGKLAKARKISTVDHRRETLKRFLAKLRDHIEVASKVLEEDLGKACNDALTTELLPLTEVLKYLITTLPKLARARRSPVSILNFPARGRVVPEPYGLVLVVATWNYPLLLALEPVLGAYAAGNQVVLKLSKRSPKTMQFIRWLINEVFSEEEVFVVGDELEFLELLKQKFDYIFYTGGTNGGREILRAAAEHLTPVTLELGGKSPCIVDKDARINVSARRIVWGKFTNAGQTCVAPDYLLVHRDIKDQLMAEIKNAIRNFFGEHPLESPFFQPLIDNESYERISSWSTHGRLIAGGEKNPARGAVEPTVIDMLDENDPLLTNEIFGPVLPVVEFSSEEQLFKQLCGRPKPLALYYFGSNRRLQERLISETSSGALVFNDVVMHFVNPQMPFGGVGESGMGAYHGHYTFELFSHFKPVMFQTTLVDCTLRYPPFAKWQTKFLNWLVRHI